MGISKTKEMYEKGLDEMKSGRIEHGVDLLSSAFLFRLGLSAVTDLDFVRYFRYEFSRYFTLKNNTYISFQEGDMISDLIMDTYKEMESLFASSIPDESFCAMLIESDIVFPCQNETKDENTESNVS